METVKMKNMIAVELIACLETEVAELIEPLVKVAIKVHEHGTWG
jgi:hypothetical protein